MRQSIATADVEAEHVEAPLDVDLDSLAQVYWLRFELASLLGRLAPLNCGDADTSRFADHLSLCDELDRAPDATRFAKLNLDFNLALLSMIGNAPLREITERLYFQTTRIWIRSIEAMRIADEITVFSRQIFDVIEALKIGDHGAAGDICRAHISMSFERMRQRRPASLLEETLS